MGSTQNKVTLQPDSTVMSNFITELHCTAALLLQAERTLSSSNEMKQRLTKTNLPWWSAVHVSISMKPHVLRFSVHLDYQQRKIAVASPEAWFHYNCPRHCRNTTGTSWVNLESRVIQETVLQRVQRTEIIGWADNPTEIWWRWLRIMHIINPCDVTITWVYLYGWNWEIHLF